MDTEQPYQIMKKINIEKVTYHYFLKYNDHNYLIVIIDHSIMKLIDLSNYDFKIVVQYNIEPLEPIDTASDNQQNLYFLCKDTIYRIGISEIMAKSQLKKCGNLTQAQIPRKILCLSLSQRIVVYDSSMVFMTNGQMPIQVSYPRQIIFSDLKVDQNIDNKYEPFVVCPNKTTGFPYVFSSREAFKWKQEKFINNYIGLCQDHYLEDQKLKSSNYVMAFSSQKKIICLCFQKDLLILECFNKQYQKPDVLLKMRMRIDMEWKQVPYSCSIQNEAGLCLIYADKERVGCLMPLEYKKSTRKIKQKENNSIDILYSTSLRYSLLLSTNQKTKGLKLYLAKF